MNKKGALDFMIKIAIGLGVGIFLILFGVPIFNTALGIVFPDISELTEKAMNQLSETIISLQVGENSTSLFYMTDGFVLVAFDKSRTSGSGTLNYYERPVACFDVSCLVICKNSDSKNSCKNSNVFALFEFDKFDVENKDTGIVSLVQNEYVELYVEKAADSIVVKEVNEN